MPRLPLLKFGEGGGGAALILLMGRENDSPWNETERLRDEVHRTFAAADIPALAGFLESARGVVGRGVVGRVRSADCERLGG